MFGIGTGEMLLIGIIIFILFGASKMGEIGKSLGQGIKEFKKAISDPNNNENIEKKD